MERLWNGNYVKIFTGNFMIFFSFYFIMTVLPLYLADTYEANKHLIGVVLSGYTLTALVARSVGGYLADSYRRKTVLMICYSIFFLFFAGYLVTWSIMMFAIVRTLHGFPFGALTVTSSSMAVDVLHPSRRAEGIGYYGLSNNLAMASGPALGLLFYRIIGDANALFIISLITAGIGLAIDSSITTGGSRPAHRQSLTLKHFILIKGLRVAATMALLSFGYGIFANYLAIYTRDELSSPTSAGLFFIILAVGLMASRFLGARSLRKGRITRNGSIGVALALSGYTLFAAVQHPVAYYLTAILIGLGNGFIFAAFFNMCIELAGDEHRGAANSTLLTSWDVGVGLGVLLGGMMAENLGFRCTFIVAAAVNALGVIVYFISARPFYIATRRTQPQ